MIAFLVAVTPYFCLFCVVVVGLYLVYDGLWGAETAPRNPNNAQPPITKDDLTKNAAIARRRLGL